MTENLKTKTDRFLNDSPAGGALLVGLIVLSIVGFALETEFRSNVFLKYMGTVIAVVFGVEYGLRVWSSSLRIGGRKGYVFSFFGLIDLIAFLPALILPAAGGGILFRLLRLSRLLQILKIKSVRSGVRHITAALAKSKGDLVVSFVLSLLLIFVGAVAMYFVEGKVQPEVFGSIPRAIWWSVATLTTVGYGDVYPITPGGKFVASFLALVGIAAVAMPAGILAGAFSNLGKASRRE